MQDFDTLRHRVEETAERLSIAQSERQDETQSLIKILRDLEDKYSAQEQQFAYYKARLEPLEESNGQLTSLIENLLDLIDRGFGESSLDPLRKASEMAAVLLERDLKPLDEGQPGVAEENASPEIDAPVGSEAEVVVAGVEREMATLDDIELNASENAAVDIDMEGEDAAPFVPEEDVQVIQDLVELVEESSEIDNQQFASGDDTASVEQNENQVDEITDLELEEIALSNLEEDIEASADNDGVEIDAIAASVMADLGADDADVASSDMQGMDVSAEIGQFDDVSDAVLSMELEEDAIAGLDDLPEIVKTAAADFAAGDTVVQAVDEADTIAALASAMEEKANSDQAPPPAPSDIRSLMLRVEALAKKAEAMRIAQEAETGESQQDDPSVTAEDTSVNDAVVEQKTGVAA